MQANRSEPGSLLRLPPSSTAWRYRIPACSSVSASLRWLNCGLRLEPGEAADVHERRGARLAQHGDELVCIPAPVSDGEDTHLLCLESCRVR